MGIFSDGRFGQQALDNKPDNFNAGPYKVNSVGEMATATDARNLKGWVEANLNNVTVVDMYAIPIVLGAVGYLAPVEWFDDAVCIGIELKYGSVSNVHFVGSLLAQLGNRSLPEDLRIKQFIDVCKGAVGVVGGSPADVILKELKVGETASLALAKGALQQLFPPKLRGMAARMAKLPTDKPRRGRPKKT